MNILYLFALPVFLTGLLTCKSPLTVKAKVSENKGSVYRIMFYNTENLFDTENDTLTDDDDFTPAGKYHWTHKRYDAKIRNTYKVIMAAGIWQPPDIIGLCEVENLRVLEDITNNTPFSKYKYRIIHSNSYDKRGIDVAMLYNPQTIKYISHKFYAIHKKGLLTRDILYVKVMLDRDTCHFFMNHWPSRAEGQLESEPNRIAAARLLKSITDSLFALQPASRLVIMGDFNDEPGDESMLFHLNAKNEINDPLDATLYNLSVAPEKGPVRGTLKYQGFWNVFDQVIVSGSLLNAKEGLHVTAEGYQIFHPDYLLLEDKKYNGHKPYRTYNGYNYQGGFSDHLPVYIDLVSKGKG